MSNEQLMEKLQQAILELDDEEVARLIEEGLALEVPPMEIILDGLSPGLTTIGDEFEKAVRFMSDIVIAGEIMNEAMEMLRPAMEAGDQSAGDTMVVGTVAGDQHNIGKRIVSALFTGAGYRVVDVGENAPASEFVKAAGDLKATVVGASCILSPQKLNCKVINDALVEAGIRDDLIYIVGGWAMTQEWSDRVGADAYGKDALDAVNKVRMIRAGELPKLKARAGK